MSKGKFITLEGIDGAGKSSHHAWLAEALERRGHEVVLTREPGGTPLGETLRGLLLKHEMHLETEALLMFAARREHLARVIMPALEAGKWVVSDRFTDASFAYQGGGRGIPGARLSILEDWVQQGLQPDLTLLFDVPLDVARQRLAASVELDRFEQEKQDFFQRVRTAYLERAARFPERIRVVDSTHSLEEIRAGLEILIAGLHP
jgi:dTMP kinase